RRLRARAARAHRQGRSRSPRGGQFRGSPMKVGQSEREYVVAEALALAEIVPEGEAKLAYQEIAWAADQGDVPEGLSDKVGQLVALAVETGRARSTHGPAGVRALLSVWRNTPQGQSA